MTARTIAQIYRQNKKQAAARTRAAIRLATVERLAQLPASELPLDQRIQRMLQASRPNCQDVETPPAHTQAPAARLFRKCPSCGSHSVKSMGGRWYWGMSCGDRWQE